MKLMDLVNGAEREPMEIDLLNLLNGLGGHADLLILNQKIKIPFHLFKQIWNNSKSRNNI